ncbi:MAG: hypothetical protein AAF657_25750 [Acidobacteriota bacterium]
MRRSMFCLAMVLLLACPAVGWGHGSVTGPSGAMTPAAPPGDGLSNPGLSAARGSVKSLESFERSPASADEGALARFVPVLAAGADSLSCRAASRGPVPLYLWHCSFLC